MNTPPKSKLSLSAKYLGPVLSLNGEVTKNDQNLIFARNGTGKSFLSRALRYLDLHAQGDDISDAALNLVSDESPDGKGEFSISRGTHVLGALSLEKSGESTAQLSDTIFHVFSEDFMHTELRERSYNLDGDIKSQIAVDSENIQLKDAQGALAKAQTDEENAVNALRINFESNKVANLLEKAAINKRLKEYSALDLEGQIAGHHEKPKSPKHSFSDILKDLDTLKLLPSDPVYPAPVNSISLRDINLEEIADTLQKITSPSSVSEIIKQKIEVHHEFYKTGVQIVQVQDIESCPFCEQNITTSDPRAIIDTYVEYFEGEEEKHKSELRAFWKSLDDKDKEITQLPPLFAAQKTRYDALKRPLPSKKDTNLDNGEEEIKQICKTISSYKKVIEKKAKNLASTYSLPEESLSAGIDALLSKIDDNNAKVSDLTAAVKLSDEERKSLQRKACEVLAQEFIKEHWGEIEALKTLRKEAKVKTDDLRALENSGPSAEARERVAETFELLLKDFFAEKYVFDKDNFTLKRGEYEMARGPHRTLSDGEKAAIAFCYFIASIHRKVGHNSDYQKLFLIFDDPVTSMSYDYIFAIAQTLKYLSISKQGEVSISPGQVNTNTYMRPELLVLTHSSYFFNISITNRIVPDNASCALHPEGAAHKLSGLNKYIAPFQQQLTDIYEIANGSEPDHRTGNAVRSVLEAVGRFCRPDKQSLGDFIKFLAGEEGVPLKSILIHNLSHGSYYDETPAPEDLRDACKDVLNVVDKYATGQIEIIKSAVSGP